jgi:hypothetical protein
MRTSVVGLLAVVATAAVAASQEQAVPAAPAVVLEKFLTSSDKPLTSYKALRRLSVAARGGKMKASLVAESSLDPERGFEYRVIEEEGSGFLRSRVLHPVLEAERQARLRANGSHGALSEMNYKFTPGELSADGLLRVAIKPKRKDELLMEGTILLTCGTSDLLQVEGLLVKRPSFWTRKVHIVRDYARIAGARVPVATGSTAEVLFAGDSTFSMSYEYEMINGAAVTPSDLEATRRLTPAADR